MSVNDPRRETIHLWVRKAETDLLAAKTLFESAGALRYPACFFAQQAAEKLIKALLIHHSTPFPKTHDLLTLYDFLPGETQAQLPSSDELQALTPFAVEIRYPGIAPEPTSGETEDAIGTARAVHRATLLVLNTSDN